MRILLLMLVTLAVLGCGALVLLPLLAANLPAVAGAFGVLLLLLALLLPGQPRCSGFHCSGCRYH